MIQVQEEGVKEKLKNVWRKDIFSILRSIKALSTRQQKAIDIYILNLWDKSLSSKEADEKKLRLWQEKIQIKTLSKNDRTYFDEYLELRKDILVKRSDLEDVLNLESRYFLAIRDARIIGAICLVLKKIPLRGGFDLEIIFKEDQAYLFQFYVVPEYRGNGLGFFLKSYITDFCRRQGYRYLVGAIDPSNNRSIHILTKLGYEKYARIIVFEQFLMKWHKFKWFKNMIRGLLTLKLFGRKPIKL
ncbi:MAG: GNAT family N-acetyltransferase [Candidatus Omnitrophica bacterium]|nr:GNAT family N-acetyltransferase [Candidatus Omnitrophota bacterium]